MSMVMSTHKLGSGAPFAGFGRRLAELRLAARIERQADLARLVKSTQQTVSRWEAGLSRPRDRQIPLIAGVLGANVDELRLSAGYAVQTAVATFDQPFPVDALSPESFERFCAYLIQRHYREASVHQMGGRGHTQDGTDIVATLPDGAIYSFQCKRAEEFGPQKVHTAIATHTVKADKKFLVLSRVASPQAREAVKTHKNWDLWDKDDLSAKTRGLPKIDQISLVDIFFAGRRFELLGVTEEGVWETTKDFFAPFENTSALFNHAWKLVGRENALAKLNTHLKDNAARIVFLVGSGGSGKSRVLKQAIESYEAAHRAVTIRFLARTTEITKKSLEELGDKPLLLIVDDAHDRTDLPLLFQFAATAGNVRLILALRPYGVERLKAQASNFSLLDATQEVRLEALTKREAEQLATQVLKKEEGPLQAAKDIARLTYDCPLATVVGAQIVAKEKKHFDLAKNEDAFRSTLFGRFESVIAGELGQRSDAEPIKKLLRVLALFQPFYLDDKALLALIEKLEGIQPHDTNRLLKLLIESGVLFKRGARYRLSPDVLADYIIEAACVGPQSQSTGYAETAFDAADERLIEALLLNLGKLDWRLSNGDASNSTLMDGVWAKLKPRSEYADPYIRSVQAVAFYQPLRAITFGEVLVRQGKFIYQLPEIFKYAAYNFEYLPRACAALWELGKHDSRPLHQHPNHPIRVLAELCEVHPNKPLAYNEAVVEFGLGLAANPAAWSFHYTPLEILVAIFKTEGHITSSQNYALTFNPFTVTPKAIAELRQRVLDVVIELLGNANPRVATRAAAAIGEALRYPMGMFNAKIDPSLRNAWTQLFCKTLERVEHAVKQNKYDPLVLVSIAKAISWHANYSKSETLAYAKRVRSALSSSLDYRVLSTLIDGYGSELRRFDAKNSESQWNQHLKALASELVSIYPAGEDLRRYIAAQLDHIQKGNSAGSAAPYMFYGALLRCSLPLTRATIDDALRAAQSVTSQFATDALLTLWSHDATEGRKGMATYLKSGRDDLLSAVGRTISALNFRDREYGKEEAAALRMLVTSNSVDVVSAAIFAIGSVARFDAEEAMALALQVNVADSFRLADELLRLFTFGEELRFARLTVNDVEAFFEKLMPVPELRGHWIETFLANASKSYPAETLDFFIRRVEKGVAEKNWHYRPTNHGPYIHIPLRFREGPEYGPLLAKVVGWMAKASYDEEQKVLFDYRSRELFEAAFGGFDDEVIQFIERWSETADEAGFKLIANILSEAPHSFVFTQSALIIDLLTRAQQVGMEAFKRMNSALFGSAIGGMKQGAAGQPFPRDVEAKADSEKILATLSKFSPAYELYDGLRKEAETQIKHALRDREEFEE
jgi:transcriptional regulator with XRE-family HTH domain